MARLYYGFLTNVKNNDKCDFSNNVSTLIFRTEKGDYLRIGCHGDDDFGLENGVMEGRWKGLEYSVSDKWNDELVDWRDEDNDAFPKYLKNAEPVAFYMDEDLLAEHGYGESFIPTCKDIEITVEIGDETFEYEARNLITEEELVANIKALIEKDLYEDCDR